ncbi:hypothetical protein TNCV_3375501 [Trichonephila clavipes]|nr:hypothetical protein TNCV_3375501 [Trichonephila clavipes]
MRSIQFESHSHRILIWRAGKPIMMPANIIERDRGAMGLQFQFHGRQCTMSSHSSCRTALNEDIERMDCGTISDLNPKRHGNSFLGRSASQLYLATCNDSVLRLALQDESATASYVSLTPSLSMGRRYETCLAVRGDLPY